MSDWLQKCSGIWSESYDLCAYVKRVEGRRPFQVQGQTRGSTWAVKYRKCFLLHILSHVFLYVLFPVGFPGSSVAKNLPANSRDRGLIPGSGRSSEEGNGNPCQYSCLGNPMDRGAWWAAAHGVTKELDVTEWLNNNPVISCTSYTISLNYVGKV